MLSKRGDARNGGMIETPSNLPGAPVELSIYASENGWHGDSATLRRFSLRIDGFVSVNAKRSGGNFLTTPITFDGDSLELNIATSAAGGARVAIESPHGGAIEGFSLMDCDEVVGDQLDYRVTWKGSPDLSLLKGRRVRMRIQLSDADLYSYRFV